MFIYVGKITHFFVMIKTNKSNISDFLTSLVKGNSNAQNKLIHYIHITYIIMYYEVNVVYGTYVYAICFMRGVRAAMNTFYGAYCHCYFIWLLKNYISEKANTFSFLCEKPEEFYLISYKKLTDFHISKDKSDCLKSRGI